MKYKIVGWLVLVLGGVGLIQQITVSFVVYPKLSLLYDDFAVDLPTSTKALPYISVLMMLIMAGVIFTGGKLAFSKNPSDKWYNLGLAALILIVLTMGYYLSSLMTSMVYPIYNLTSNTNL